MHTLNSQHTLKSFARPIQPLEHILIFSLDTLNAPLNDKNTLSRFSQLPEHLPISLHAPNNPIKILENWQHSLGCSLELKHFQKEENCNKKENFTKINVAFQFSMSTKKIYAVQSHLLILFHSIRPSAVFFFVSR